MVTADGHIGSDAAVCWHRSGTCQQKRKQHIGLFLRVWLPLQEPWSGKWRLDPAVSLDGTDHLLKQVKELNPDFSHWVKGSSK
jgi:hypothetical protein